MKEFLSIEFQNSRLSGGCMEEELFYRRVESQQSDAYVWVKAIRHIDENEHTAMITLHQEQGVYPRILSMKQELDKKEKAITRQYWDTVSLLSNVLEHNQLKEADQQDRIGYYTKQIYRQLQKDYPEYGITDEEIETIAHLAPIHDIGKIRVPIEILNKEGKLTEEEWNIIRRHPLVGAEMTKWFPKGSETKQLKDALVNNIPYNQETNNQNKPMQSYGKNPSTYKGARRMGTTFVMGEKFPEPTCEGYEFLGWKLKNSSGKLSDTLYKHGDLFTIAEDNYAYADNTNLPVCSWTNFSGYQIVAQWKKIDTKRVEVKHWLKVPNSTEKLEKTTPGTISFATENESVKVFAKPEANGTFPGYVFDTEDSRNELEKEVTNNASADTITLNLYYKPTQLTVSKIVKGYTLDANKAFTFTIQAQAPSGTDSSGSTIQAGQIYIKKSDGIKSLDFTDNKATFTLKDKESVEISCLPMGWTYTVEEADPGENFKTTYQRNEESAVDGRKLSFIMDKESEDIKFVNASKVAPPVTGRSVKNNSFVLLAVLVLGIGIVGYGCFKRMKRKH